MGAEGVGGGIVFLLFGGPALLGKGGGFSRDFRGGGGGRGVRSSPRAC